MRSARPVVVMRSNTVGASASGSILWDLEPGGRSALQFLGKHSERLEVTLENL